MHVVFREQSGLEEAQGPVDLGQSPADLAALSFSDGELGAFASGWAALGRDHDLPSLRLANLAALTHPLSVDTYLDATLSGAKAILLRLIGGAAWWPHGLQQVSALARRRGIVLAVLPADGRPDPQLEAASTLPPEILHQLTAICDAGGPEAAAAALALLARQAGLPAPDLPAPAPLPRFGVWPGALGAEGPGPKAALVFYRSFLAAADMAPIEALSAALQARGIAVQGYFVPSLKDADAAAWLTDRLRDRRPDAIVNATAFSAKRDDGATPLDAAGAPVFQIALSTAERSAWAEAERGLSPGDLAMHAALPEVDGRIFAGVASFKEPTARDDALQFARRINRPEDTRIAAIAARIAGWISLGRSAPQDRRPALVLSSYPGKDWNMAHAVGLDAPASAAAILEDLRDAGHDIGAPVPDLPARLAARDMCWPLDAYRAALATLPGALRDDLHAAWGPPESDPDAQDGAFRFAAYRSGAAIVALQPDRDAPDARAETYHDLSRTPRHGYVAFYLWLRSQSDALIHIGAHGTLEWLPGKAVALSDACWPEALTGPLPVIYPFIVNDPGEAAQAKRRIGAVTLGHVPPPMVQAEGAGRLTRLEALLDEFSTADGLDPARRDRLQGDIRAEASGQGLDADLGLGPEDPEAIARIDAFVCDVKDAQFADGLHIWGRPPPPGDTALHGAFAEAAAAERRALIEAVSGRFIPPGPAGSPHRGRMDVLPTGRNMFSVDPRAIPSESAFMQGGKLAHELVRRHLQDHGDWPRGLIVDLWGSATMRTAGEEFAMALHLIGARPVRRGESGRVTGVEITPLTEMDRPRIDVTLRVSGLFRDVFPTLPVLFGQAVRMLCARDEAPDHSPYAGTDPGPRVFAPAPGSYGAGVDTGALAGGGAAARRRAGEAWLAAGSWALDGPAPAPAEGALRARVAAADGFVHLQDLPETDLLAAADYAAHEGGFAAARAAILGGDAAPAAMYHLDAADPDRPRARPLAEEIARVVRARAADPAWLRGMGRHGFRGGAEIAATLAHMAAFQRLARAVGPHLFDLYFDATLGDPDVTAFLADANPAALAAMQAEFRALHAEGLWTTRRNSILAALSETAP